ncbi:hypothetical protein EG329_004139 [Mollisiaceae sp. DMI_Dod_QoI]|nr:hypothetical protein EG329_004139 [Helotiales sp. DMI_Dod_QoI]
MAARRLWTWPTRTQPESRQFQGPKFALIENGELDKTSSSSKVRSTGSETSSTRLRKLLHSLGLESIYILLQEIRGRSFTEQRKIAILGDLRSATYVSILHIVPTAASATLLALNWKGYYIGSELSGPVGEDGLKFLGLQFAAKMLELLAMASLSTILFALVRSQLISGYLPLGAMTAGFEFSKLSLLWSKEFIATCATRFSSFGSKTFLVATIIVFTMLGAAIGPSAAVASQPVLRDWPAGGTVFWLNATAHDLWPLRLDQVAIPDLPCNYSQNVSCFPPSYSLLANGLLSLWPSDSLTAPDDGTQPQVMPERVLISGHHSVQTMATRFRGPLIYQPELTVATAPSAMIADAVSQIERYWFIANTFQCIRHSGFCYYNDIIQSIDAMQPVTYVRCSASNVNAAVRFSRLDQGARNYPLVEYNSTVIGSRQWFDSSTANGTTPSLSWVELSEADFGRSSIGAVVALPGINSTQNPDQVLACTVDARWANATTTISFLGGPTIASGLPTDWFVGGQLLLGSNGLPLWPQIKLAPAWGDSINPIIEQPTTSIFAMLCNSVGRLNNVSRAQSPINAVESVLAVMITDSLSRTSSMATIMGSLKGVGTSEEWKNELLPKGTIFNTGGSAFNYSYQEGDQSTKLEVKTTVNGYGYGITTATLLSTLVLLIYSLIAISYIIYTIFFAKTTSSSWESITELVALAMNSKPSSAMQNTGAGIATLSTLKQPIRIRVSDDRLQIVFEEQAGDEKVAPNDFYS